jgi:hypothetical protein
MQDLPLSTLRRLTSGVSFEQYTSEDDSVPVCADLTDDEIINNVVSQRHSHDETLLDNNDDDELPSRSGVTIFDAMDGLDAVRDFLHQQGIGSDAETERAIAKLSDISSMFSRYYLRRSECKQTSISDFFVNVEITCIVYKQCRLDFKSMWFPAMFANLPVFILQVTKANLTLQVYFKENQSY